MAARQNAQFSDGKTMNWKALFVKTDMNESGSSHGVAHHHQMYSGESSRMNNLHDDDEEEGFKREMRDFEGMLSNLNPFAQDYVPPIVANGFRPVIRNSEPYFAYVPRGNTWVATNSRVAAGRNFATKKQIGSSHGNGRVNERTTTAQREDAIRRTVFVPDIENQVNEEQLAAFFFSCGQIVEIRISGDPKSTLRFAFIEFADHEGAKNALCLAGKMLCCKTVKVLPSKTAIAPINPTLLPRSEKEMERCGRTIYCANIDNKVARKDIRQFFESFCGEVLCMRVLGDKYLPTRIAFVEFVTVESAVAALNCSGVIMGSLAIRISPSKTPVVKSRKSAAARAGFGTSLLNQTPAETI